METPSASLDLAALPSPPRATEPFSALGPDGAEARSRRPATASFTDLMREAQGLAAATSSESAARAAPAPPSPAAPASSAAASPPASAKADSRPRPAMGFMEMIAQAQPRQAAVSSGGDLIESLFGKDGLGWDDLLAAINPLQHIPILAPLYRGLTGDTIEPGPRMMGGALYGGIIGFAASAVDSVIAGVSGKDIGGHVYASLFGETGEEPATEPVMVAEADAPGEPVVAIDHSLPWLESEPGGTREASAGAVRAVADDAPLPWLAAPSAGPAGAGPGVAPAPPPPEDLRRPLTAEQLALLREWDDGAAPAPGASSAAAPPPSLVLPDKPIAAEPALPPDQADLLLRSVGMAPLQGDANESDPSAGRPAAAPPGLAAAPEPRPPLPLRGTNVDRSGDPDFAQRMRHGLDKYLRNPRPLNPDPPRLDIIR